MMINYIVNFNDIYNAIISEPLYLSISILLLLSIFYSILKKFFKLLIICLIVLVSYLGYLIYTNQDLPGNSDELIYPLIDSTVKKATDIINEVSQ